MCREILDQVIAPAKSALVVVSTAEPMVASETRELCERISSELGRRPALVVVNRVPRVLSPGVLEHAASAVRRNPELGALAEALKSDAVLRAEADAALSSLGAISGARLVEIPELGRDPSPRRFAELLGAGG
jgi:hypothetical protein